MSNPNKSFAAAKNSVYSLVDERCFFNRYDAEEAQEKMKAENPNLMVKLTSFKLGPRNDPQTKFMVRSYTK